MTTVWKMDINRMWQHVAVTTAAIPPIYERLAVAPGGRGREDVCPIGYTDDTQAITLEPKGGVSVIVLK